MFNWLNCVEKSEHSGILTKLLNPPVLISFLLKTKYIFLKLKKRCFSVAQNSCVNGIRKKLSIQTKQKEKVKYMPRYRGYFVNLLIDNLI